MRDRRLDPEEEALWRKVTGDVRPTGAARRPLSEVPRAVPQPRPAQNPVPVRPRPVPVANTLDGGWDRRLGRGMVGPDVTIDLHGHTLASAHTALDVGLARAVAVQARLILLVTGKDRPDTGASPRRGVIRAAMPDWLAMSRFADRIAAVRTAHPRHGGAGALYLVLRRAGR